jgi:hypothetical protein
MISIPVAVRSKVWIFGLSYSENAGSNPAGAMEICLLSVVFGQVVVSARDWIPRPEESHQMCVCDIQREQV